MGTSASFALARKLAACLLAVLLSFTLLPASALAQGEATQHQDIVDPQAGEPQETSADQVDEGPGSTPAASPAEGGALASALVGTPTAFVNSDVALDGEPIVGSFTVDGMTFAVTEGSDVELVGVSPDRQQVASSQEGDGSPVAPMLASGPDGLAGDGSTLALPESIAYEGVDYAVASIGAYAFYLSGITAVELPATVADVDDRAFRSSDVASVAVADGNPTYSSFDGALYSADYSSLLLIPEGKQGTVLLPKRAEVADAGKFSHCSLASAIAVEEGSAAFASENGLLYDASLTTLLRVPAGATDITIRDGCTTIAAGAMEACASLATITAPASVASISPDVFTSVPTISLPVASAVADDPGASTGATVEPSEQAGSIPASDSSTTQLTAMVALSSTDDDLPEVDPSAIEVSVPEDGEDDAWKNAGFAVTALETRTNEVGQSSASSVSPVITEAQSAALYNAVTLSLYDAPSYDVRLYDASTGTYGPMSTVTGDYSNNSVSQWTAYGPSVETGHVNFWVGDEFQYMWSFVPKKVGYRLAGWSYQRGGALLTGQVGPSNSPASLYSNWAPISYSVTFDMGGAPGEAPSGIASMYDETVTLPTVTRQGYRFIEWYDAEAQKSYPAGMPLMNLSASDGAVVTLYAQWERVDFDLGFDVDSEPGDEDCPGIEKPDETVNVESGPTVIEDPKRPGYVFQGWTIPNAEGTEAIDQDLVYKDESDGKWYVDASKLPDYANDEGRVELTARWTSVISVDVPSSVTFYADVVTQGNESREGAASSAFGQNKVASQSEVDLRIVGLESTAVATQGSTLGADSILKKASSATPSSSTQKLFSLYPTDKALTPDGLQDPDAVSTAKPADAVDFALDDLLLEKSFAAEAFTIPAGDTLNLGYRLNLAETGTELDYDTLSALDEGQSASIANISYCFAADYEPIFWTSDDDGSTLGLASIRADAEAIAAGDSATISKYTRWMNADHRFYVKWYDQGVSEADDPTAATVYEVRIIGLNHDDKADGSGKAGITFQFVDCLKDAYAFNEGSGGTSWGQSTLRSRLNDSGSIWSQAPQRFRMALPAVRKVSYDSGAKGVTQDKLFLVSISEIITPGTVWPNGTDTAANGWGALAQMRTVSPQYALFSNKGVSGMSNAPAGNQLLVKKVGAKNFNWFTRSVSIGGTGSSTFTYVASVSTDRIPNGSSVLTAAYGICPAFCL